MSELQRAIQAMLEYHGVYDAENIANELAIDLVHKGLAKEEATNA